MSTPWSRQWELFAAALELRPAARSRFLAVTCPDAALRAEVERLLAAHERKTLLDRPLCRLAGPPTGAAADIGASERLSPGRVVAERFEIRSWLGSGGMGDVYEAEDRELGDRVALKVVRPRLAADPAYLARFRRETSLARGVTHPNVCRTFDFGQSVEADGSTLVFLSMELLDGETLGERVKREGPLELAEVLTVAEQVAAALAAAHAKGVVHRDLKPGNVMLTAEAAGTRAVVTDFGLAHSYGAGGRGDGLTREGQLLGTPEYLSPEQMKGEAAGPATDVYGFGLLLYEMVAGRRPHADSAPISGALRRAARRPPSPRRHRPALPRRWERVILQCLEPDPRDRPASPEAVVAALRGGRLVSRRGRQRLLAAAAGVALLALAAGWLAWRLPAPDADAFEAAAGGAAGPAVGARSERSPALEEYLLGRYAIEERTHEGYRRALEHFRRAAELDPELPVAHAGMAQVYGFVGGPAEEAAQRALALDPECAEAHAALGFSRLTHHFDWEGARQSLRRAIQADPAYAQAHHWYAYALLAVGRREAAVLAMRAARDLDPLSLILNTDLGNVLILAGRVEEGLEQLEETLRLDPGYGVAYWRAGEGYLLVGDLRRSGAAFRRAVELGVDDANYWLATGHAVAGEREKALKVMPDRHDRRLGLEAMVLVALGEHDAALARLERAYEEVPGNLILLLVDPFFDSLRGEPRFQALLRRMGLPVELSRSDPEWARVRARLGSSDRSLLPAAERSTAATMTLAGVPR